MLKVVDDTFEHKDPEDPVHAGKHLLEMLDKSGITEMAEGEFVVIFNSPETSILFSNEGSMADILHILAKEQYMLLLKSMGVDIETEEV